MRVLVATLLIAGAGSLAAASPVADSPNGRSGAVAAAVRECFGKPPTLVGTPGPDRLVVTGGRGDVVYGRGGDDVIVGLGTLDNACGGRGDDILRSPRGFPSRMDGQLGNDRLVAGDAILLAGGPGDDELVVTRFAAFLRGGPGADVMRTVGRAREVSPGEASCAVYDPAPRRIRVDLATGRVRGEGRDRLNGIRCVTGTPFPDEFVGSNGAEDLTTGRGDDTMDTRGGRDVVFAGAGADTIELGPGNDSADGDAGDDRILGQAGKDSLVGWADSDFLSGGPGDDSVRAGTFCDPASFADGTLDRAPNNVLGGRGNDILAGDLGDDRIDGGPGRDRESGGATGRGTDVVVSVEQKARSC